MVDKNLFLYDLAVAAIMKDEEPYVKEWLDYHLLAGVDHFYIYDNESTPEFKKILQPYIDVGIVTYTFYPGKARQYEAYNDALKNKFSCKYMAWIDGDEFIFPKVTPTITQLVDEILSANPQEGGLAVNRSNFGSNNQEKADFTRGVLERFTRRAPIDCTPPIGGALPGGNSYIKTITNPRRVAYFDDPHHAKYFLGSYSVNEQGKYSVYQNQFPTINYPVTADKIVMNHYHTKSYEEYEKKVARGNADGNTPRTMDHFKWRDTNDEFDDGILKYRDSRRAALIPTGGVLKTSFNKNKLIISDFSTH